MDTTEVTLILPDTQPVDLVELGEFLFLLRGTYAASVRAFEGKPVDSLVDDPASAIQLFNDYIQKLTPNEINELFSERTPEADLHPKKIQQASPIEIVVVGLLFALVGAVIVAGGKVNLAGLMKFELKPIGPGIQKLRGALMRTTKTIPKFRIGARTIRLSKQEFDTLMDPDTVKGQGGFQTFFAALQAKVNRSTKTLELSESDMERIFKHGRNPSAGGWQAKIKSIFGRHFDL